jgi:nicotinamide phosphoribosyltransferase
VTIDCLHRLSEAFGYTVNSKGYRVLHDCVRLIYGDSMTYESISALLQQLKASGWSADNVAFGMGGGLLQKIDRDTQSVAMKCSSIAMEDDAGTYDVDVFKSPLGDVSKHSLKGNDLPGSELLRDVFLNGDVLVDESLETIRQRASVQPVV